MVSITMQARSWGSSMVISGVDTCMTYILNETYHCTRQRAHQKPSLLVALLLNHVSRLTANCMIRWSHQGHVLVARKLMHLLLSDLHVNRAWQAKNVHYRLTKELSPGPASEC